MGLKDKLMQQLGNPHGWFTPIISRSFNKGNRNIIQKAISASEASDGNTVLDIGFGGGVSLGLLAEIVGQSGHIVASDPSIDIIARARKKERKLLQLGKIEILNAGVENLPLESGIIDAAISCNTFYFWNDIHQGATECARVLRPGARMVLGNRTVPVLENLGFSSDRHNLMGDAEIEQVFLAAGFREFEVFPIEDRWASVLYVATK